MESYNEYERFKGACNSYSETFTTKFFDNGSFFCHPMIDGLIYVPCTPEEAKSNGPEICRMSDMLLMSADGEEFVPFKIAEARAIAEQNDFIYITDLCYTAAFKAASWMIDGKHDTLIISEEHMKKEGKPYAPVTPLTNVRLYFKKITNHFLYKKGTPEEPVVLSEKDINSSLDALIDNKLSDFPALEIIGSTEFELFGKTISTDKNESRCAALDKGLKLVDELRDYMAPHADALKAAGVDFEIGGFCTSFLVKAAAKCGVTITAKDIEGDADKQKDALRKIISEKNSFGFKYAPADKAKTVKALHDIEQSSASPEEIKKEAAALMASRPGSGAVYNITRAASPADAETVENISEYWGVEALSIDELGKYLAEAYIPEKARDEEGRLCCSGTEAALIMEDISTAAAKYKIKNVPVLKELEGYREEFEIASRTYNGTVFDSVDEMEKAVKNEKELIDLCSDLSALDEAELKKLRKYIYDMPLDKKTTGKYLIKIKLALNDCQENQIKLLCTGLTLKKPEELAALKKKLEGEEIDSVIAAPYKAQVDEAILSASLKELTEMFKDIPDEAKAKSLEDALNSGKYDKMFNRHFAAKIADARDGFARKKLTELCGDISAADKAKLDKLAADLKGVNCRESLKAPYIKQINDRYAAIEEKEVADVFAAVKTADKAKLAELKKIIESGKYKAALTEKYAAQISDREVEINNAEFTAKCDTIPKMDKAALDAIVAELSSGKYPESITQKYIPMTEARAEALLKEELAAMCKGIGEMNFAQLDELEKKLADEKYGEKLTEGYTKQIADRRKALFNKEADEIAKGIANADKAALAQIEEKLKDEKYDAEYNKKFFTQISDRINKIENDKLTELTKNLEKLKKDELEKLTADITALEMRKENKDPYLEKIRKQEISLMKSELENLCKNIANTKRSELSKLREALSGDDFDKELSAKYIEQIDKRTAELIKKELEELCKNYQNAPKDKLLSMKKTIDETPEYAEPGKAYAEQISTRLRQIDKAEFDKQMASIEKLNSEELDKFMEDLDKRKPALDAKIYEQTLAKCKERGNQLEKEELEKIVKDLTSADIAKLNEMKEAVSDGGFTPENAFPYIKKIDDAINTRQVEHFSKLMENINTMSRAELFVLLEEVIKNETNCSDDMLQRYIGKVNSKIREADRAVLDKKCQNLGNLSERRSFELIKDINEMDIDPSDKKRYVTQVENHIVDVKARERDGYVERLLGLMEENMVRDAAFYIAGRSKAFEGQFLACKSFASLQEFEQPILIHEYTPTRTDDAFMLTLYGLYFISKSFNTKDSLGHINIDRIERFEAKKTLFSTSLIVVEKDNSTHTLPFNDNKDKKAAENVAKVLSGLVGMIQKARAETKLHEAEEIRAAEEAKLREMEQERLEIEAARKKGLEKPEEKKEETPKPEAPAAKPEEKKEEAPKAEAPAAKPEEKKGEAPKPAASAAKPADAKIPEVKPIKAIKPIEVVVSTIPEVKPLPHIEEIPAPKSGDTKAPEAKKPEAPAAPAAENKPVMRMKFCDQCGAKITNEKAKFCAECGNKLAQ